MLSVEDVRDALGNQLLDERPGSATVFSGVSNDSRTLRPGELFVALSTEVRDGHDFVAAAIAAGAAGIVAHREVEAPAEVSVFRVKNSQTALGNLAAHWRNRFDVKCIVVTGNVGKTTTKELCAALLSNRYRVLKSPANFNDEIGLSMTLFQLTEVHERAVLEVGMFGLGEIARMCEIARPEIGVVMNVGPTHLERLGSLEAIARAKAEAIESLPATGTAILNADDPFVSKMGGGTRARVLTFGVDSPADIRASAIRSLGLGGVDFDVSMGGRTLSGHSPLPGVALVSNALAAIAVAVSDGLSLEEGVSALRTAEAPARMQVKTAKSGAIILDDCYNASPASTLSALSVLAETPGRRIALLGDMLELGAAEEQGHRDVGRRAAEVADLIFAVGPRGLLIAEAAQEAGAREVCYLASKEDASPAIKRQLREGDVLLIKASHGVALESVVVELTE
jgi:UDP-N-acetylmuramoyl-tripeptide--D-alanyl-D-alanine ligase